MATKLPYVNQPGSMVRILNKIQSAQTPDRFTTDFLETKLGCKGGNYRQFIPLAKKLGLLGSDGSPTDLYKKFNGKREHDGYGRFPFNGKKVRAHRWLFEQAKGPIPRVLS